MPPISSTNVNDSNYSGPFKGGKPLLSKEEDRAMVRDLMVAYRRLGDPDITALSDQQLQEIAEVSFRKVAFHSVLQATNKVVDSYRPRLVTQRFELGERISHPSGLEIEVKKIDEDKNTIDVAITSNGSCNLFSPGESITFTPKDVFVEIGDFRLVEEQGRLVINADNPKNKTLDL